MISERIVITHGARANSQQVQHGVLDDGKSVSGNTSPRRTGNPLNKSHCTKSMRSSKSYSIAFSTAIPSAAVSTSKAMVCLEKRNSDTDGQARLATDTGTSQVQHDFTHAYTTVKYTTQRGARQPYPAPRTCEPMARMPVPQPKSAMVLPSISPYAS